jgi:hypothetical protein
MAVGNTLCYGDAHVADESVYLVLRIQILAVRELLDGHKVEMPPWHEQRIFKYAPKAKEKTTTKQSEMFGEQDKSHDASKIIGFKSTHRPRRFP